MRKIQVDLDEIQDEEYSLMYDVFGLDVQNKSYEDFERRMLKIQLDTIVEIKNRERNLYHARQFQKSDFGRFETIVVMDNENYRAITSMASCQADKDKVVRMADFLTHHREYTTVPDPYYGDYSDFELVITLLEDACQGLLNYLVEG